MKGNKLAIVLAITLLLQAALPILGIGGQSAKAAAGPAILNQIPANHYTNAPLGGALTLTFDESVKRGTGNAAVSIYKNATNELFESFAVATSSLVSFDSAKRTATIRPSRSFELNTDYYVLIDWGAFVSDSTGTAFSGLTSATEWTFRTIREVDNVPPAVVSRYPDQLTDDVPITTGITLNFSEPVYAAQGEIHLNSDYDNRDISVTSQLVRGSGSGMIQIGFNRILYSKAAYTVTIPAGLFQDAAGNPLPAQSWSFRTAASPVNMAGETSPANQAKLVPVHTALKLTFDQPIAAATNKFIEIRRVGNNSTYERIEAADVRKVTVNGNAVAIAPNTLEPGVAYYVLIDAGAFYKAGSQGDIFPGVDAASRWTFVTDPGPDPVPPGLAGLAPARGAVINALTTPLKLTFTEPVYPDTGSIEIRNAASGALYKTLPVTSSLVTGGGTPQITIDPNVTFMKDSQYYVTIGTRAFRDAAGNYFAGVAARTWLFTTTERDAVPPSLSSLSRSGSSITLTYNEALNAGSVPSVTSFTVLVDGSSRPILSASVSGQTVMLGVSGSISASQNVRLSYSKPGSGGIQDLAGNQADSLSSRTIQDGYDEDDTEAPELEDGTFSGKTITLFFDEDLASFNSGAYRQFKVLIDGDEETPLSIKGNDDIIRLTMRSSIDSDASVYVTYDPGSYPLKDLAGNRLRAFSKYRIDGTGGDEDRAPALTDIEASGRIVTLSYDKTLSSSYVPSASRYTVKEDGYTIDVSTVRVSGSKVILTLSESVSDDATVKVSYSAGSPRLQDLYGNAAASFSSRTAGTGETDGDSPVTDAVLTGDRLKLTFDTSLSGSYVPNVSQFIVKVRNSTVRVAKVSVSGRNVTLTLQAAPGVGETVYVTYTKSSRGLQTRGGTPIESFVNVKVSNETSLEDTLPDGMKVGEGGGIVLQASAASTETVLSPSGQYGERYVLDTKTLSAAYQTARSAGLSPAKVAFEVPSSEDAAMVAVPLSSLQSVGYVDGKASFAVVYDNIEYEVPVDSLDYNELYKLAAGTVTLLLIEIERGGTALTSRLLSAAGSAGATAIASPFYLKASIVSGSRTTAIDGFKNYLKASVSTSGSVNAAYSSIVTYDIQANKVSYVPTSFASSGGTTTATAKLKGNGAYALVRGSHASYADVGSHWAGSTLQSLAGKFIIDGRSQTKYEPQKPITRGEFAMFIARGLGLSGDRNAAAKFADVNVGTAIGAYIGAATKAGIVSGVGSGSFKPNSPITREEMAVMMSRAATAAGVSLQLKQAESAYLQRFADRGGISTWAKQAVAKAVYAGVITGKTANAFSPKTNATRAEAAVMIKRLLEYAEML